MSSLNSLSIEGDGFIANLFYYLWCKDEFDNGPDINIPDTVLFQYTQPSAWYFTSKSGKIKRKSKLNVINIKIEQAFTKDKIGTEIVAYYIFLLDNGESKIEYYDNEGLRNFLYNKPKTNVGMLQKFIEPKGSSNNMLRAIWSPKICLLERRTNLRKLYDRRYGLYERAVTFEGPELYSSSDPVRGSILPGDIQYVCQQVVDHIGDISYHKHRISRMALNLKVDADDKVWILYASSIRLFNNESQANTISPNLITLDSCVHIPNLVQLHTMTQVKKSHIVQTFVCNSCAATVHQEKSQNINYKAILTQFNQLLVHLKTGMGENNSNIISWPPDESVIKAAGGVGFGILKHIERSSQTIVEKDVTIPPPIQYTHPSLTVEDFHRYRNDPVFLHKTIQVCEDCYLVYTDFSTFELESNSLHRKVPSILRPQRQEKLHHHFSRARKNRENDSTDWAPVHNKPVVKHVKKLSHRSFLSNSSPELPSRIDQNFVNNVFETDTIPCKYKSESINESNLQKHKSPGPSTKLREHEDKFFAEIYKSSTLEKSHPLSHMIESATRLKESKMKFGKKLAKENNKDKAWNSCSLPQLLPLNQSPPKLSLSHQSPYSVVQDIPNNNKEKKKKVIGPKRIQSDNDSSHYNRIQESAALHRDFLMNTLNKVREQLETPDEVGIVLSDNGQSSISCDPQDSCS